MKAEQIKKLLNRLKLNPYVPLVLLTGLVLIFLPTGEEAEMVSNTEAQTSIEVPSFSLTSEEERLSEILNCISGVGETRVLLSLDSTATRKLASLADEAIVVSTGSGKEEAVEISYEYPTYLGAVVVCQGAENYAVKLAVTEAVSSYTGLGAGDITVLNME